MHPGAHAKTHPDKPAVIMGGSGEVITYRQLDEGSNRCAQLFRAQGLQAGDGIAIFMENHPRYFELTWAAQRAGLYYTAISSQLTAPEVEYIVKDSEAKLLFTSHGKAEVAADLAARLPQLQARYMLGGALPGYEAYEEAVIHQPAEPIPDEAEGQDLLYSSGTTGRPKGVKVPLELKPLGTPSPLLALLAGLYRAGAETIYLSPAPNYHAAPLRFTMSMMRLGATCVVMEKFDPVQALRMIEKYRVTHSQWVPTMFVRMLKLPEDERAHFDVSSLQCAIHAAAPCPIPIKEQLIGWWGPILHEYYAGTEGNGFTAINSEEWLAHKGSVGRALAGEIHILDDQGNELPAGETGVVYFGGGPAFEYHNDPEKTAQSFNDKGWSTLGDIGYLDDEGYLYLTDRKANMIISGGVNIYPQEAENALVTHPKVIDAAVFGVPNPDFGEEVKAVVQPADGVVAGPELERELIEYCQAQLAGLKCPRSIDFENELPRHPNGKLYKRLLKERYWGGHETTII
jgi:acyl-CoA synthetase (AMP-forming)/AMP-acid ligase II